jgi:hypothetical protein
VHTIHVSLFIRAEVILGAAVGYFIYVVDKIFQFNSNKLYSDKH